MSVQTGAIPPSGPASKKFVDRARYRFGRVADEPNPIWIRELRQAARLARTPIILMVVAILMTLLIASIGGIVSTRSSPSLTGVVIFQVFFSLAYYVVTLVGPAVAANSIASEREGRTWEAVILTGLPPGEIARGKFLAAYTAICMYIVMLAPVGALPFLFGGVTATEVVVAFIFLFLIALLSVAFGLAISSKMTSLRVAIVVTLLLAFPITIISYLTLGLASSYAAHSAWPGIEDGYPVWLPTAYARAPFDLRYLAFLILLPIAAVTLPAWFLYEVTVANLTSITDDRSTGLKRWFVVATPVFTLMAASPLLPASASDKIDAAIAAMTLLFVYLTFCVFLFQGDPIGPSRRVRSQWDKMGASRFRRFLGPSIMRASTIQLVIGLSSLGALALGSMIVIVASGAPKTSTYVAQAAAFLGYGAAFFVFLVGAGAWLRARSSGTMIARVLLFTALFTVTVGPWIVAAIAGLLSSGSGGDEALLVASPSPIYAFVVVSALDRTDPGAEILTGAVCSIGWAVLGLALLGAAQRKCSLIIRTHEAALAQTDQLLAAEDEAAANAAAGTDKNTGADTDTGADAGTDADTGAGAGTSTDANTGSATGTPPPPPSGGGGRGRGDDPPADPNSGVDPSATS